MASTTVSTMRRRGWLWASLLVVAVAFALAAPVVVSAHSETYGVSQTRACLHSKGATFNATTPGVVHPGLTAAQQAEVLTGTLPVGGAPILFFVVVGRNGSDAAAVLGVLRPDFPPGTRWVGAKQNAAWTLVSITGALTPTAKATFVSCLAAGAPPSGVAPSPATYAGSAIAQCFDALSNGAVIRATELRTLAPRVFGGRTVPAAVLPHTLLVYTATNASSRDGIGIFLVVAKTRTDAVRMRDSLRRALALNRDVTLGAKKNAGWIAFRLAHTTVAGRKAGLKALATCLN